MILLHACGTPPQCPKRYTPGTEMASSVPLQTSSHLHLQARHFLSHNQLGALTELCCQKVEVGWCSAPTQPHAPVGWSSVLHVFLLQNCPAFSSHPFARHQHLLEVFACFIWHFLHSLQTIRIQLRVSLTFLISIRKYRAISSSSTACSYSSSLPVSGGLPSWSLTPGKFLSLLRTLLIIAPQVHAFCNIGDSLSFYLCLRLFISRT